MPQLTLCDNIISTCVEMQELGINQGTSGNVSVRTDTGFLITPSAIAYDTMLP
ncbi:MAG: class II aldolase/adducin family protein, partial [Gammaproteobacteria bacterium]|nr:class II aldolase/adducin family protein [Gammaproteobacteria bacterium]